MRLERFILDVLAGLPEDRLLSAMGILGMLPMGVNATMNDVEAALQSLTTRRQVFGTGTDDGMLFKITPAGKARLA